MIEIKEAITKKEMKDFVMFSFELYKNNPYWIPPIVADELETLDKTKNPALKTAEAHFYLAYKDNKIVGKIAAIINWEEVNLLEKRKARFGWFDVIDDIAALTPHRGLNYELVLILKLLLFLKLLKRDLVIENYRYLLLCINLLMVLII